MNKFLFHVLVEIEGFESEEAGLDYDNNLELAVQDALDGIEVDLDRATEENLEGLTSEVTVNLAEDSR